MVADCLKKSNLGGDADTVTSLLYTSSYNLAQFNKTGKTSDEVPAFVAFFPFEISDFISRVSKTRVRDPE